MRRAMGLTGQTATVDELLTGRENIALISALYGLDRATARRVGGDLLERFSLTDAAERVVKTYSGGMRRRLDLAVSLVATPPVLFLDEPTTGLDPRSRVELWEVLRELVRDGTTLRADDAVPRGGRPAGRPHRGDRPGPDHRRGHAPAAEGPVRGRRRRGDGLPRRRPAARPGAAARGDPRVPRRRGRPPAQCPRGRARRHDPDRRRLRRQRHRARRPRAQATQPRRRVPPPHRPPGRGATEPEGEEALR